jgi:ribosomal protein S12 methylthiotransferase accessory factor
MIKAQLDASTQRLLELVSPKVGIIRSLSQIVTGADEPTPPIIYQATLSHFDYRKGAIGERMNAGKGLTENDAVRGAIGEAIEHYCASQVNPQVNFIAPWASVESAGGVAPPECVLYSETQYARKNFPYRRWSPQDEVMWTPMRELPDRREACAPATLVYLSSPSPRPEDFFTISNSNGLAAGPSLEFAVLHGLYELIERDGFLLTWMNKLPVPEVTFSASDELAYSIRSHYARYGTEIRVFNISTDLPVYAMMGVALDKTGTGPAVVTGLGCHLNPSVALTKAVLEVCQVHPGEVQRYHREPPAMRLKSYEDVHTLEDHSAFLSIPERLGEFSFLLGNGRRQSLSELKDNSQGSVEADLDFCVSHLVEAGCRVLYADLTTPDVVDYGLSVVRTFATGLQPMHFGYGEERLGGKRLFEIARILGYATETRGESELNPCPHPLA